jgi:predicted TIM-barrel fold metal-dependent hydrolase
MREGKPWGVWGSKKTDGRKVIFDYAGLPEEPEAGVWRPLSPKYRLADMERDGVHTQVLYNFLDWSFENQNLKTEVLKAFNTWLAEELCAPAPDRLVGLGMLPGHDAEAAVKELRRILDIGLKGVIFDVFNATIPIADPAWDPLWALAAEAGLPINVHIGAGLHMLPKYPRDTPWRLPVQAALSCVQLDEVLGIILFCGMLQRHPKLKIGLGEAGIGWIPYVLERFEFERDNYKDVVPSIAKISPRELFRQHIYPTFSDEVLGIRLIEDIGVDNVMWASDYPHGDGTFPHSKATVDRMFKDLSPEVRRKATCTNAAKLYGIKLAA